MKALKQSVLGLVMVFVISAFFGFRVDAANRLAFQDPTGKVGEEISVRVLLSGDEDLTKGSGTLTYDTSMLEFKEGTNATGSDGKIQLNAEGSGKEIEYTLKFRALKQGTTKIEVESFTAEGAGGAVEATLGSSAVTINAGANGETEVAAEQTAADTAAAADLPQVEVSGGKYTIAQDFTDAEMPDGFTATEITYEGNKIKAAQQESTGQKLIYLQGEDGEKRFFLLNEETGKVDYLEQIYVTNSFYIILLNEKDKVDVPSYYKETTITKDGHEFPAWQNTENPDFYAVYALSSAGSKGVYSYDSVDETYQRMLLVSDSGDEDSAAGGLIGKAENMVRDHLRAFVLLMAVLLLALVVILVIVAVKLRHRNLELDDLYDEYGIDVDEEDTAPAPQKNAKQEKAAKKAARTPRQKYEDDEDEFDDDDEFDEFDDDDDEFDDLDDEFEDQDDRESQNDKDENDIFGDTIDIGDLEEVEEEPEDDDDMVIEDLDELLEKSGGKSGPKKKPIQDDDFDTDFIDLD